MTSPYPVRHGRKGCSRIKFFCQSYVSEKIVSLCLKKQALLRRRSICGSKQPPSLNVKPHPLKQYVLKDKQGQSLKKEMKLLQQVVTILSNLVIDIAGKRVQFAAANKTIFRIISKRQTSLRNANVLSVAILQKSKSELMGRQVPSALKNGKTTSRKTEVGQRRRRALKLYFIPGGMRTFQSASTGRLFIF